MRGFIQAMVAMACVAAGSSFASASPVNPFQVQCWTNAGAGNLTSSTTTPNPDGTYDYVGTWTGTNWSVNIDATLDSDPSVVAHISAFNNTGGTLSFFTSSSVNVIPPLGAPTKTGGSISGSVTDGDGDGATVSALPAGQIYMSKIDGVNWQPMLAAPFSQAAGSFASVGVGPVSFGTPIPNLNGPAALATISIDLNFNLTAHDSASFTSNFVVTPEPASLGLLAMGSLMLLRRRA